MACRCYNRRIAIEREGAKTPDGQGGYVAPWDKVCDAWAAFESPNGRESLFANQLQASVTHTVFIRYRPGITAAMRVNYGGKFLNIRAVLDDKERHEELKLLCEEGVAT